MKAASALVGVILCAAALMAEQRDVSFPSAAGATLKGGFYSTGRAGPGILLLHDCDADRREYDELATMLSGAGYNVLALDLREDGKNAGRPPERTAPEVDTAIAFLTSQPTVNKRALGIVGAGCGVNEAVHAAERHAEVRTLVLLAGASDAAGEAILKKAAQLPVLGASGEDEPDVAAATKKTVSASPHRESRMQTVKGSGHAASMFAKEPELEADIVIWFRSNLPPGGYGLPPAIK